MITALLFAAIAGGLIGAMRRSSGIGRIPKPKRNRYAEVQELQRRGIDFSKEDLSADDKRILRDVMKAYNWKPGKNANYTSLEQAYFDQLKRTWKSAMRNDRGGEVAVEKEVLSPDGKVLVKTYTYDPAADLHEALSWFADEFVDREWHGADGYAGTALYIASEGKFIWEGRWNKAHDLRLSRGIADEVARGKAEKKWYRRIIADEEHGGISLDAMAERLAGYNDDDTDTFGGVVDAIRDFNTPEAAQEYILNQYYDSRKTYDDQYDPSEDRYAEVPF